LLSGTTEAHYSTETIPGDEWNDVIRTLHTPAGELTARFKSSNRGLPGLEIEHFVKSLDDLECIASIPYEPVQVDPAGFFESDGSLGDDGVVMCSVANPLYTFAMLMGSELLAIWSIEERDMIVEWIYTLTERTCDILGQQLAAGIGPAYCMLGEEYITPPLHSAKDFREFCVEPEKEISRRIHDAGCILHTHCHGPLDAILEDFVELGSDVLHPVEAPPLGNVTIEDAKRRIGGQICIEGNIQIGDIYSAPTQHIVDEVKRNIDAAAPGGGYVLAPTASPHTQVLTDQTVKNYVAMVETAAEYGR
jgi:uroporphyrinogen-III decarboxylase